MKNIIILEDSEEMGGVQHSTINFIRGLPPPLQVSVHVFLPGEGGFSKKLEENGIAYSYYPPAKFESISLSIFNDHLRLPNLWAWWKNAQKLRKCRHALYHLLHDKSICMLMTKGMGSHFLGGPLAKKMRIECIMYLQDEISNRYLGLNVLIFNRFIKKYATLLIADGVSIRNQLWSASRRKCHIVYNGVSATEMYRPESRERIRTELKIPTNAFVLANLARITPWKGQHILLDAFIRLVKEEENAFLILMGSSLFTDDSYFKMLRRKVKDAGIENKVIFTGYTQVPGDYFAAMDLFVYTSVEKDTAPLALLSALMSGKPVIMSDITSLREIYNLLPEIVLFKKRDIQDLYLKITKYRNGAVNVNLGIKARELFSIEAMSNKLLNIIQPYLK